MTPGSLCAACGQEAHRYGRNEGIERFNPQACINGLLGKLEEPPAGFTACDECEGKGWVVVAYTRTVAEHDPNCDGYTCSSTCPIPVPYPEEEQDGCPSCRGSGLCPTDELREAATDALADHYDAWNVREDIRDICDTSQIAKTPRRHPELMAEVDAVLRVVAETIGGQK